MTNAVERAIKEVGGPTQASFICRVSVGSIYKWRNAGYVMDTRAAVRLSRASGISVDELAGMANGDGGPSGTRREGGKMSATYPVLESSLPVVPRYPDTAARAA